MSGRWLVRALVALALAPLVILALAVAVVALVWAVRTFGAVGWVGAGIAVLLFARIAAGRWAAGRAPAAVEGSDVYESRGV